MGVSHASQKAAATRSCALEDLLQVGSCRCLFVSSFLRAEASRVRCCSCDDIHAWAPSILHCLPATFIVYCSRQRTLGGVSSFAIHAGTCYLLGCSGQVCGSSIPAVSSPRISADGICFLVQSCSSLCSEDRYCGCFQNSGKRLLLHCIYDTGYMADGVLFATGDLLKQSAFNTCLFPRSQAPAFLHVCTESTLRVKIADIQFSRTCTFSEARLLLACAPSFPWVGLEGSTVVSVHI